MHRLLTEREILILLKYCKLHTLKAVGELENISSSRVSQIRNTGLRKLRYAARITIETPVDNIYIESKRILINMTADADIDFNNYYATLSEWIIQGFNDRKNLVFWEQITSIGKYPTPEELLDFILQNYVEKIFFYWISR